MKLAIKGHSTRGNEVIELLEMLGGKNRYDLTGTKEIWYILWNSTIKQSEYIFEENGFSLEEFEQKFPYKVGDKVKIERTEDYVGTIIKAQWDNYEEEVVYTVIWDDMIELSYFAKSLKPYKEETINKKYNVEKYLKVWKETEKGLEVVVNDNFDLKEDNGKFYIIKKQSQYPKTYEECCEVLDYEPDEDEINCYRTYLIEPFVKLLICRNAYWKIAKEQMGLDKPWKPDYQSDNYRYCIVSDFGKIIKNAYKNGENHILSFPTDEIRDTFYENFKDLIEQCKELL